MSDNNGRELIRRVERAFADSTRMQLMDYCQDIALNFYPERARFTAELDIDDLLASHIFEPLVLSYRFELGLALGEMQRPRAQPWFRQRLMNRQLETDEARQFLDRMSDHTYDLLYKRQVRFQEASNVCDQDKITFGNSVSSLAPVSDNKGRRIGTMFRDHHLADVAWEDDRLGEATTVYRKDDKITLLEFARTFGKDKLPESSRDRLDDYPHEKTKIVHVCFPADDYEFMDKAKRRAKFEFASVYIDPKDKKVLREGGYNYHPYQIDRWFRFAGSQYAMSPIMAYALPGARVAQMNAKIFLDAAERQGDPPLVAYSNAVAGNVVNRWAGGTTFITQDWQPRGGSGRPVEALDNQADLNAGVMIRQDMRETLAELLRVSKLTLPSRPNMTAAEVYEQIETRMRTIAPLIEPFEVGQVRTLETFFKANMEYRAFDELLAQAPQDIFNNELEYEFDGPIHKARRRMVASQAQETIAAAGAYAQLNPATLQRFDFDRIAKKHIDGIGAPADWLVSDEVAMQRQQAQEQQQAMMQELEALKQAGEAAKGAPDMANAAALGGEAIDMMQNQQTGAYEAQGLEPELADLG